MIEIKCDERYCYERFSSDSLNGWRQIKITYEEDLIAARIIVSVIPIEISTMDLKAKHSCPKHWRNVAREALENLEIFPEPVEAGESPRS
jgi:hypothetical protein